MPFGYTLEGTSFAISFRYPPKYLIVGGTYGTLVPLVKADMKKVAYVSWLKAKADLGEGRDISNAKALEKLVDHFNRERGRRLI